MSLYVFLCYLFLKIMPIIKLTIKKYAVKNILIKYEFAHKLEIGF